MSPMQVAQFLSAQSKLDAAEPMRQNCNSRPCSHSLPDLLISRPYHVSNCDGNCLNFRTDIPAKPGDRKSVR
jgi:hypothetical protein